MWGVLVEESTTWRVYQTLLLGLVRPLRELHRHHVKGVVRAGLAAPVVPALVVALPAAPVVARRAASLSARLVREVHPPLRPLAHGMLYGVDFETAVTAIVHGVLGERDHLRRPGLRLAPPQSWSLDK